MTLEEEIRRAGKAREILENEIFKDAVRSLEEALLLGIRQSAFKDSELREKLCQQYTLLHGVVGQLKTHMETGELAEEEVRRKTVSEKVKAFFQSGDNYGSDQE